jgi:hypothetical protein
VYVDAGATVDDNVDGDITTSMVTVNPVDTAIVGAYMVTYNVVDAAGNHATEVSRTVNVTAVPAVDTAPPVIIITAPTKSSTHTITDTTIRITDDTGIMASNVSVDAQTTASTSAFNCTQSSSIQIDCVISIATSGSLAVTATDNAANSVVQTESGYSITPPAAQTGNFVVGHTHTDLSKIPAQWITRAKSDLHIAYNHTSHGSQLISGMNALEHFPAFGDKYAWRDTSHGDAQSLSLDDRGIPGINDLSNGDRDSDGNGHADWADRTYDFLIDSNNYHVNVIMWSWCNISGHDIQRYLDSMEWLIGLFGEGGTHSRAAAYPVKFVFMTAHANGQGENDSSDTPNKLIRQHVIDNDRILFDFSDIENYDPDNNYFLDRRLDDALNYDADGVGSREANWATEYLLRYDGGELDQLTHGEGVAGYSGVSSCAHSPEGGETADAKLNCVLKGRGIWYLFARLAGWDGKQP